ncbi:alpha-E domain-containing protein [Vitiosangium sp. GDMCC 1.1324]|uniref:alpha-E domain-containing protein n=1 Tax=Vitiosangium sp. (strain GDMCC 1.1324) TaxID=2138576 RepID=UPI000D3D23D0|nr:alpha-E domain-containing protein [Vitiosangium sp. GDMCC 1.1324]PTL82401.1 alpha-E domain-containing protein [Vitiosangium sp. GDMCC 1.1324]
MIARIAEHCFWLGRYLERAESTARVLQMTGQLALDAEIPPEQCWMPALAIFGERDTFAARHGARAEADGEDVQQFLTWDEDNASSLVSTLLAARNNARTIREVVSRECWEVTNELYLWLVGEAGRAEYTHSRFGFYQHIRRMVQLCLGLFRSTMLHDTPLDFIWLGVLLERVGQTARLLDVHHHVFSRVGPGHRVVETALWLSLLRACSGFEPFMKSYSGKVTGDAVAAFLLFEARFPRSVRYCLESSHRYLRQLCPPGTQGQPGQESLARIAPLLERLRPEELAAPGATVHALLTHVVEETAALCELISREYFGTPMTPVTQAMAR